MHAYSQKSIPIPMSNQLIKNQNLKHSYYDNAREKKCHQQVSYQICSHSRNERVSVLEFQKNQHINKAQSVAYEDKESSKNLITNFCSCVLNLCDRNTFKGSSLAHKDAKWITDLKCTDIISKESESSSLTRGTITQPRKISDP